MTEKAPHPRVAEFISACDAAGVSADDVVKLAGIHKSVWYRWKNGDFAPSMKNLDAAHAALVEARQGRAA